MPPHAISSTTTASDEILTLPKITPFRLVFILTTGGLGIAKAILASQDRTRSSTTVEWIAGVVVALIFQFLGSCEYSNARPKCLDPLFCYDLLRRSNAANGEFDSDSQPLLGSPGVLSTIDSQEPDTAATIITRYRLMVSMTFATLGLGKMSFGYLGLSSAMSTLEWIIAIPLTLGVYYTGLYEERKARSLRGFFEDDYSSETITTVLLGVFWLVWLIGFIHYSGL